MSLPVDNSAAWAVVHLKLGQRAARSILEEIAVAVTVDVPIFVAEDIIDEVGQ